MDKDFSKKIIRNTFENKFDKSRFANFIVELLNLDSQVINEAYVSYNTDYIPGIYWPYIDSFEKIAGYESDGTKLDILVVRLNKESSVERARTMQRNFVAWYLGGGCDGQQRDAALAAFVSPDEYDWRFSLIKMDYSVKEDKKGDAKLVEQFSPAKRWSFLVGSNERSHTAQIQLLKIVERDDKNITLKQLEEAFSVEKVTKEFFEKYRELFFKTKEALDEILARDLKIKTEFKVKNIETVDFTKKLLGQIVFLYFLQKKGWFGVSRDGEWGTGPKKFLRELFEGKHKKYKNFFNDILEPLFYEALRMDRGGNDDYYNEFNCKIPFLNGGLFDPIGDYDWVKTEINISNRVFSNLESTKEGDIGTGILDIFDRYNFTVQEDEPLEKEVAVDPEMLGKVFENLLEVKDRKSKGTYYTPREIVHYMCQQSLINYLSTELEGKVKKEDIDSLVKHGEKIGEDVDSAKKLKTDISSKIIKNSSIIDEGLASIKVCDPAVGSGAFLVGMMSEIIRTRNVLSGYMDGPHRSIYGLKRDCIENNLYGVDIDIGAVEICKLRLWLSLIVDEEDIKQIKPLPNLDYKIVCGNSLWSIEKNLFTHNLFDEIENHKKKYFNEINPSNKKILKEKIDNLIYEITSGHNEFDYEVYFSEVFHNRKGFDVVIGNPPYGLLNKRQNKSTGHLVSSKEINRYKESVEFEPAISGMVNVFRLFIVRSINLLKENGFLTEIFPLAFTGDISAGKLRKWILKNYHICGIEIFPERDDPKKRVFENVKMSVCILNLLKKKDDKKFFLRIHQDRYVNQSNEMTFIFKEDIFLFDNKNYTIPLIKAKDLKILKGIYLKSNKLSSLAHCYTGEIDLTIDDKYITDNKNDSTLIKGALIDRYLLRKKMSQGEVKYLNSDAYLNDKNSKKSRHHEFKRIVMQGITGINENIRLKMMVIDSGIFCANSVNYLVFKKENIDHRYYLALLNSSLMNYIFKINSTNSNVNGYEIDNLPIISNGNVYKKRLIEIVENIINLNQSNEIWENKDMQKRVKEYEKQIDNLIFSLYELSPEEIEIVKNF